MYYYFVCFNYLDHIGNMEICINSPIISFDDIRLLQDKIIKEKSLSPGSVVINNFILLRFDEVNLGNSGTGAKQE